MDGIASILVVDDNPKYLADALPMYGYDVTVANDGLEALKILDQKEGAFDLILLDVMMPNMDGWDTLKAIRSNKKIKYIPVIMITAVSEDQKVVSGLRIGADDYIVKPFESMELLARIEVVLRRTGKFSDIFEYRNIKVDFAKREVFKNNEKIEMTAQEFELLKVLIQNKNLALSREKLLESAWGYDYYGDTRTIDSHVKKIRHKLGKKGKYIKTIRGIGYKFEIK